MAAKSEVVAPGITRNKYPDGTVSFGAEINLKGYPRLKKTWDTLDQAAQWRRTEIGKLKDKAAGLYVAPSGSIGDLVALYIKDYSDKNGGWSRAKQEGLNRIVKDIGEVMVKDFTKQAVIRYAHRLRETRGASGAAEILMYLNKAFKIGHARYDMDTPRDAMKAAMMLLREDGIIGDTKIRDRVIHDHEIAQIKQHLSPLMQGIVDTVRVLPFRISEMCAIRWEHFNELDRSVKLFRKNTKKNKTTYYKEVWVALPEIDAARNGEVVKIDTFDLIFKRERGAPGPFPITGAQASDQFSKAHRAAGIDVHLHDCRAEGISALVAQGFDPVVVAELSGHEDMKTFKERYCRFKPSNIHNLFKQQARINQQARRVA